MQKQSPPEGPSDPERASLEDLKRLLTNPEWYASAQFTKAVGRARLDNPQELTDVCLLTIERTLRGVAGYESQIPIQMQTANQALDKLYTLAKNQGPKAMEVLQKRLTDLVASISEKDRHPGYKATHMEAIAHDLIGRIHRQGVMPQIAGGDYLESKEKEKGFFTGPVSIRESYQIQKRARKQARKMTATHGVRDMASTVISGVAGFCLSRIEKWTQPRPVPRHGVVKKENQLRHSPRKSLHPERPVRKKLMRAAYFIWDGAVWSKNYLKRETIIMLFNLESIGRRKRNDGLLVKNSERIPHSPKHRSNIKQMRRPGLIKRLLKRRPKTPKP